MPTVAQLRTSPLTSADTGQNLGLSRHASHVRRCCTIFGEGTFKQKPDVSVNKKLPDSEEYRQADNSIIVLTIPNIVQHRQTSPPRLLLTEADNTINDDQDQDRVSRKSCVAAVL